MLTLIYSQLIFCTIAHNFIYKGALGLSQLFSCGTPCLSTRLFLISISFAPIFPFPQGYLYPCYVLALFTACSSLWAFSGVHCIQSFALFSVLPALLGVPETQISHPEGSAYCAFLCRLWCMKLRLLLYRYHPLGAADHPRALEKHHLTVLLCSFTHAGEFRHFSLHA